MVTQAVLQATVILAAWEELSALDRARLKLALLALLILLAGVIVFVLMMGRWARRQVSRPLPPVRYGGDRWTNKPSVTVEGSSTPDAGESAKHSGGET